MTQATVSFAFLSLKRAIARGTMGFWSTENGWVDVDGATRFNIAERESLDVRRTGADDGRWVVVAGDSAPEVEAALATREVARAVAKDMQSIGHTRALDSSVDILVARAAQGDDTVLWDLAQRLRQFVAHARGQGRSAGIRALRRADQQQLDSDDAIRALGVATITSVGSENVYLAKDGAQYYFKPACNRGYAIGVHDFGTEPEPSSGAVAVSEETRRQQRLNGGLRSSRELAERYPSRGSMPSNDVHVLFVVRALEVARLAAAGAVRVSDLAHLDRGARFKVADTLFDRCDADARRLLLNDAHPHVRSAAAIARLRLETRTHVA